MVRSSFLESCALNTHKPICPEFQCMRHYPPPALCWRVTKSGIGTQFCLAVTPSLFHSMSLHLGWTTTRSDQCVIDAAQALNMPVLRYWNRLLSQVKLK